MTSAAPLGSSEHQERIFEWNATQSPYPRNACIHELFEARVEQEPDAVALVIPSKGSAQNASERFLTYCELNHRANALAYHLKEMGITPGALIAVYMQRSIEMIVAFLGILKAGGAYVPLDLSYPNKRLEWMLEDTKAPVLLTQSGLKKPLFRHDMHVVYMDSGWGSELGGNDANPSLGLSAESLAYVIYTSGSTGQPKGACVPHRGVVRLVCGTDYTPLDSTRVLLQLASASFDAATFEIWGALLHGAKCVLYPSTGVPEPQELERIIREQGVSTLWLTTSLFNAIINEAPQSLRSVNELLTGGEALSVPHVRKALQELPDTQLINCYGPTENTTFTTTYKIPQSLGEQVRSIPIGRPIANSSAYILDDQLQPVASGEAGELYVGGDGLATGYLNRADLTVQSFIKNPFSDDAESILYKTGDRVRLLQDGNIDFLGRFDDQVKLRGFRIELGEIESALLEHECVREAVVLVCEVSTGEKALVAYITKHFDVEVNAVNLREFLRTKLPDYMVPAFFIMIDKVPLTPNGKADRQALPLPEATQDGSHEDYIAPQTATEKTLAQIWSQMLGSEKVSVEDNFFDIGGTSTLSIQVAARIQEAFDVAVPIVKLYQYPTIRSLAKYLDNEGTDASLLCRAQNRAARRRAAIQRQNEMKKRGLRE